MAILLLEGFEGYSSLTNMLQSASSSDGARWSTYGNDSATMNISGAVYRTQQANAANSRSFYIDQGDWTGNDGCYIMAIVPDRTELIMGVAFYKNTPSNYTHSILNFGGTSVSDQGISIGINGSKQLIAATATTWGQPNTVLGTTTQTLSDYSWHYIEARVKLGTTDGEVEVYLDGVQVLNLINVNTATGSITSYARIGFGCNYGNNFYKAYFDDLYLLDTSGATNNTFLGPTNIYSLMPVSNGSQNDMAVTGAANNWEAVDDATVDDATSYVGSGTSGHKEYYGFESLPATVSAVSGVLIKARCTLATAGLRKFKFNIKQGASTISSALKALSTGSWLFDQYIADTAPDGSAWDKAKVDSTEGGVEID